MRIRLTKPFRQTTRLRADFPVMPEHSTRPETEMPAIRGRTSDLPCRMNRCLAALDDPEGAVRPGEDPAPAVDDIQRRDAYRRDHHSRNDVRSRLSRPVESQRMHQAGHARETPGPWLV